MFFGEKVLETGIFLPAGQGKASYTTRLDMAEATANILMGTDHEKQSYILANTTKNDLHEVAEILSSLTGKSVNYLNPSIETYTQALTAAGVPAEYIGMFAGFAEAIRQGEFDTDHSDLETLLNRKPTSVQTYLKSIYSPDLVA